MTSYFTSHFLINAQLSHKCFKICLAFLSFPRKCRLKVYFNKLGQEPNGKLVSLEEYAAKIPSQQDGNQRIRSLEADDRHQSYRARTVVGQRLPHVWNEKEFGIIFAQWNGSQMRALQTCSGEYFRSSLRFYSCMSKKVGSDVKKYEAPEISEEIRPAQKVQTKILVQNADSYETKI